MYCDVFFEKFKNIDTTNGIECIIDKEQVLLKKVEGIFKYHSLNNNKTKYLNSSKSAKFKHVDDLIEDKHRLLKTCNEDFEKTYQYVKNILRN